MKLIKTFHFIMKYGRMRLPLAKRIRNRDHLEIHGEAWNLPRFDPNPPRRRGYISSEFPNLPQPPPRPKTPTRKFTTTRCGDKSQNELTIALEEILMMQIEKNISDIEESMKAAIKERLELQDSMFIRPSKTPPKPKKRL